MPGDQETEVYRYTEGESPLLVSIPHCGTAIPDALAARMTEAGRAVPDADWHVDRLYDFAAAMGASVIAARLARYVIDLNRPPDDEPLYPGADNTGLCPTTTFDHAPIYAPGAEPDADEIAARRDAYWRPYHDRLSARLAEIKARHGLAVLFDAHSIRSRVPRFFEGRLPDLNLGSGGGKTADPALVARLVALCAAEDRYSHVLDGRFKGGYITRAYGRPEQGVHAVQLELAQATYMDEAPPFAYRPERAERLRPLLRRLLGEILAWTQSPESGPSEG